MPSFEFHKLANHIMRFSFEQIMRDYVGNIETTTDINEWISITKTVPIWDQMPDDEKVNCLNFVYLNLDNPAYSFFNSERSSGLKHQATAYFLLSWFFEFVEEVGISQLFFDDVEFMTLRLFEGKNNANERN